jgi:hypothetical protein
MLWDDVAASIDVPRPMLLERLLRRLGVSEGNARLVSATRPLQAAWLAALVVVMTAVVGAAREAGRADAFLVVAPVVPLIAVAAAFAVRGEPAGEAGKATPVAGAGLALRRTAAVLVACLVAMVPAALALPGVALAHAAWILPALGLSLGSLALATWVRIEIAATGLGLAWLTVLGVARFAERGAPPVPELAPLTPAGQLFFTVMVAASLAVIAARRDRFAMIGSTA